MESTLLVPSIPLARPKEKGVPPGNQTKTPVPQEHSNRLEGNYKPPYPQSREVFWNAVGIVL